MPICCSCSFCMSPKSKVSENTILHWTLRRTLKHSEEHECRCYLMYDWEESKTNFDKLLIWVNQMVKIGMSGTVNLGNTGQDVEWSFINQNVTGSIIQRPCRPSLLVMCHQCVNSLAPPIAVTALVPAVCECERCDYNEGRKMLYKGTNFTYLVWTRTTPHGWSACFRQYDRGPQHTSATLCHLLLQRELEVWAVMWWSCVTVM